MEQQTNNRATKKQKELLNFIDGFIKGNGYGPSYREVMRALEYKSVSTVATHINSLIAKGYLEKTGTSARSLRVTATPLSHPTSHTQWLAGELARHRAQATASQATDSAQTVAAIDRVATLFGVTL